MRIELLACGAVLLAQAVVLAQSGWSPADSPLMTRWGADVDPEAPWPEYPRPTMVRERWQNLNGLWDYAILDGDGVTGEWDGKILVPYPVESALSGVGRRLEPDEVLVYRRTFTVSRDWAGSRVLLHVDAADWHSRVSVNGEPVGEHRGGYDRATYDITDALSGSGEQELRIEVRDPTDAGTQPRGKQVRNPHGIWYTPTSGIWQTVWLEPVPELAIESVVFDTDIHTGELTAHVEGGGDDLPTTLTLYFDGKPVSESTAAPGESPTVVEREPMLWSPSSPNLYEVGVSRGDDEIRSYVGFRRIDVRQDRRGITRIYLNDQPIFLMGTLDQGFWPDGLYTAPTAEAMRYDLEVTKRLGFNTVRKHVKVEPDLWYAACDRMGLLVFQDMPSGDAYVRPNEGEIERTPASAAQFERELAALVRQHRTFPSIVAWVPFNEGWGQYDTVRIGRLVKAWDPTRLVDAASGWNDYPVGDMHDIHSYPGPSSPQPEEERAAFLGEFGGLGLPLEGHTWQAKDNWGYRSYESSEALTDAYVGLIRDLHWLIAEPGLSGAIYTQTTDVEVEVNGLMTYDRAVVKMDEDRVTEANAKLQGRPPVVRTVVPTSEREGIEWRYTTTEPSGDWTSPDYDDSGWSVGVAGFGREGTPGAVNRTRWESSDIWIRRSLPMRLGMNDPYLRVHHDEDAEVYINGELAASLEGYTTGYVFREISEEARGALGRSRMVIAVHCRQTGGGQYIDVGLVDFVDR